MTLRRDLLKVSEAAGVLHPALPSVDDVSIMDGDRRQTPLREVYGYEEGWGVPGPEIAEEIQRIMYPAREKGRRRGCPGRARPGRRQPNQGVE
nr:hypothetical protein [Propioniciclava sinopodophylli]